MNQVDDGTHKIWIGGLIVRQVAAAIDVGDIERTSSALNIKHIDFDNPSDVAVDIATAKNIGDGAAKQVEGDIASDVGWNRFVFTCSRIISNSFRAAINVFIRPILDITM